MDRSRYPTRKTSLAAEGPDTQVLSLSVAERVAMVWTLTKQAWAFKEEGWHESRLRRDVVRVVRSRR